MRGLKALQERLNAFLEQLTARTRKASSNTDLRHRLTLLRHIDSGCHDGADLMRRVSRGERLLLATRLQHLVAEGLLKKRVTPPPANRSDLPVRHEYLITWAGLGYLRAHSK